MITASAAIHRARGHPERRRGEGGGGRSCTSGDDCARRREHTRSRAAAELARGCGASSSLSPRSQVLRKRATTGPAFVEPLAAGREQADRSTMSAPPAGDSQIPLDALNAGTSTADRLAAAATTLLKVPEAG